MRVLVSRLVLAAMAALAWSARPAHAAPDAAKLAERAFQHPRSVAYTGTLTVTGAPGTAAATVRVTCDGKGREQREHVGGPASGMVVITDGAKTWQRLPRESAWTALPPAPPAASWDALRRNYEFRLQGEEKIAGRTAAIVAVAPRNAGNPRSVLWLDAANALVLRSENYSYTGALAMRTTYTALKLGKPAAISPPPAGQVTPSASEEKWEPCTSVADLTRKLGRSVALPAKLPAGYALSACYLRDCARGGKLPVVRYTDGLNPLTLFVTMGGMGQGAGRGRGFGYGFGRRQRSGRGACRMEQVDGQQVVRLTYGDYSYVFVGDCRPENLAEALESVR